jgi:uronate dehydrogenase
VRHLATWQSHRDITQLVYRCIEAPQLHFVVAYGVSNNPRSLWDNSAAQRLLGYVPEDSAESFAAELLARAEPADPVGALFHGGPFCTMEFDGDPSRIG